MSTQAIKVLVVDDDKIDRERIRRLLNKVPLLIDVHEAASAAEAVIELHDFIFDCVILDYRLNDADGISLIKPIQNHRDEPSAIIMVSGNGDERVAANAIRDGVFEYLPKRTLECDQLYSAIEAGLRWAKSEQELQEARIRFRELADGLPQLVWTCTAEGECDYFNKRWAEYTGIPTEQQFGNEWLKQVHPEDQSKISSDWQHSVNLQTPFTTKYRLRRHDGEYRLFDVRAMPHKNSGGILTRWLGSSTDITDTENARLAQARLAAIVESSSDAIISKDLNGVVTSWNQAAEILFGYTANEAVGKKIIDLIIPDDKIAEEFDLMQKLKLGQKIKAFETIRRNKNGHRFPVSLTFSTVIADDGKLFGFSKIARNISEKLAAESALLRSEERFRATFNSAPVGMALVGLDGAFLEANRALQELLGYEFNQLRRLSQIDITHVDDQTQETLALQRLQSQGNPSIRFEKRILTCDRREISVLTSVALLYKDDLPENYLYQYVDLSERKQYESRLLQLAHFDPLTGLANRAKFNIDIEELLYQAKRNSTSFAVLFGDLDHFKHVNDSLGHEAGDQLLIAVSERLKYVLRHGDTVARLGGDEFVILLSSVHNFEQVAAVANKLMQLVEKPVALCDQSLHVGMSFGIAIYPSDGDDAATLLRNADSALYNAKAKGRGCFSLYRKELTQLVEHRLKLDIDLRKAIDQLQFELYFQPIISLETNQVISAEALIRWNHPEDGLIVANDFIPYAQENNLILPIGEWVIYEACRITAQWKQAGYAIPVAINLSARQFKDGKLLSHLTDALEKHKLDKSLLHIEITEQLLLEDTEYNLEQIEAIKNQGLQLYLDDFGVGYSSLSYIIRFAPHHLKIDRSFVAKIGTATKYDVMVEAIIGLSKVMPMKIIAEGVETIAQKEFLEDRGCSAAQGFLFSKALPEKEFLSFMKNYQDKIS